ncbi:unnamed protein product [Brachionus calyciflorus]|uniref:Uncharacterized protein n=1 Tax=Brachionus calyciflorus TaxID=104777 RepID=A0A813ZUN9_9BILA|nr:unnamed protein product [Brachionus calyciflorus]
MSNLEKIETLSQNQQTNQEDNEKSSDPKSKFNEEANKSEDENDQEDESEQDEQTDQDKESDFDSTRFRTNKDLYGLANITDQSFMLETFINDKKTSYTNKAGNYKKENNYKTQGNKAEHKSFDKHKKKPKTNPNVSNDSEGEIMWFISKTQDQRTFVR